MNKIQAHKNAVEHIKDNQSIMVGGFGDAGYPFQTIKELDLSGKSGFTIIGNDAGVEGDIKSVFYTSGKVRKLIISYCGLNPEVGRMFAEKKLDVEFVPQGTLAERIRSGGFGLGGVLTPTGIGTMAEKGKEKISIDGSDYLLEKPLKADVAILKAHKADSFGNLKFNYVARNYNPTMAMAADYVIAEVDECRAYEKLDPNNVDVPGIFVDCIVVNKQ
jgi:acetate CoA/acetoacetate CoA-transferase alpha subunit